MNKSMNYKKSLKQLKKNELLSIIAKFNKNELINIIDTINSKKLKQYGGNSENNEIIIKETPFSIKEEIKFNKNKLVEKKNNNMTMFNNNIYTENSSNGLNK
jgi:hypothetical protein